MVLKLSKIKEDRKNNKLIFLMKGSDEIFANTIRRMIVEEVPTLAVEDLEIKDNGSALYDEMLGLRLGLIPIRTDLKSYNIKNECSCEGAGCAQCELKMTLKVGRNGPIYAEDVESSDPKCTFVYPKMLIVRLLPKQKLDLTMTAVLGKGKDHAKWSPGLAYYKHEPIVKLGNVKDPQLVADKCSDGVFTFKNNKLQLVEDKVYSSLLLEYYAELDKGITVDYSDNIIFTVESWGQLTTKEILKTAAELLAGKAEEMEKLI